MRALTSAENVIHSGPVKHAYWLDDMRHFELQRAWRAGSALPEIECVSVYGGRRYEPIRWHVMGNPAPSSWVWDEYMNADVNSFKFHNYLPVILDQPPMYFIDTVL